MEKDNKKLIKLGKKIAEYRKEKGFSQEELGALIHSARNYIGCIERGEKSPSLNTLIKIAKALNVKVKDFIEF
jgi:transcriptional regulator with XRE-family HTH domain